MEIEPEISSDRRISEFYINQGKRNEFDIPVSCRRLFEDRFAGSTGEGAERKYGRLAMKKIRWRQADETALVAKLWLAGCGLRLAEDFRLVKF